ncbi:MAG: hypothetical protein KIT31_24395 [Deltaproteobacteria bacterium]|nr:hypothetical protein [Deltaproteobacteria bacterium]
MHNCPVAVAGTTTTVARTPDGVTLTVRSPDPAARAEVAARTARAMQFAGNRGQVRAHSGRGGGPETVGYCPVILDGNVVTSTEIQNGLQIHLRPIDPAQVANLQLQVESRTQALSRVGVR